MDKKSELAVPGQRDERTRMSRCPPAPPSDAGLGTSCRPPNMEAISSIPEERGGGRGRGERGKQKAAGNNKRQEEEVRVEKEEPTGWAEAADEDGDEDDDKSVGDHKSAHEGDDDVEITIGGGGHTKTGVNRR